MLLNRQLEDDNHGTQQDNHSSEEELMGLSSLRKKELEVIVNRTIEQLIGPVLEPLIRKVVREEIKFAQDKMPTSMQGTSGNATHSSESRILQLRFLNKISQPVMTGEQIKGEDCPSIRIALVDALTEKVVSSGPLASAEVEIVVLDGDFDGGGQNWTCEMFNQKIVRERERKGSLLSGKRRVSLQNGIAILDDISFTHNSVWMKSCDLRLGAIFVGDTGGTRVSGANTECFTLMDRRNKLYKKHYPPSLYDEVWRLEEIARGGPFHKRLSSANINTVKDVLTLLNVNPQRLRQILLAGDKRWQVIGNHARTCILDKSMYLYSPPSSLPQTGVVFNVVGEVLGMLSECEYVTIDELSDMDKADAHKLVVSAYEHFEEVVSIDDKTPIVQEASCIRIAETSSSLPRLESSHALNNESSLVIDQCDYAQPSASSSSIPSFNQSVAGANSFDGYSLPGVEFGCNSYDQYSCFSDQLANSLDGDTNMTQNFGWQQFDDQYCSFETEDFSFRSLGNPSNEDRSSLARAASATIKKAVRKWKIVSKAMRWFSRIKFAAFKRILAAKRRRLH